MSFGMCPLKPGQVGMEFFKSYRGAIALWSSQLTYYSGLRPDRCRDRDRQPDFWDGSTWLGPRRPLENRQPDLLSGPFYALFSGEFFKFVPSRKLRWLHVWPGAALTSGLFALGKFYSNTLFSAGLSFDSIYGTTGSLIAIMIWVYVSAQIFSLGAVFISVSSKKMRSVSWDYWFTRPVPLLCGMVVVICGWRCCNSEVDEKKTLLNSATRDAREHMHCESRSVDVWKCHLLSQRAGLYRLPGSTFVANWIACFMSKMFHL